MFETCSEERSKEYCKESTYKKRSISQNDASPTASAIVFIEESEECIVVTSNRVNILNWIHSDRRVCLSLSTLKEFAGVKFRVALIIVAFVTIGVGSHGLQLLLSITRGKKKYNLSEMKRLVRFALTDIEGFSYVIIL